MRKTRLLALSSLAVLVVVPSIASANCYSIYDAKNRLALQSTIAPVDLSTRISDGMRNRFPGGHLVIVPDDSDCREYRTGPTLTPRFEGGGAAGTEPPPEHTLEASPLLRGTGTNADLTTREATRSGNALNVKRP